MTTPIQNPQALGRIVPVRVELPPLDQMRADLSRIELKHQDDTVRMLAGSQRTIVDHLRLQSVGLKMLAQALKKQGEAQDAKFAELFTELQTMLTSGPAEPAAPEPELAPAQELSVAQSPAAETPPSAPPPPAAAPAVAPTRKPKPGSGRGDK
jgi:hypothetical protein